jgi:deazaflavin-dependent oxidoreductase (nitroreductase family)
VPTPTDRSVPTDRYVKAGRFTRKVFNPTVALLTRRGISVSGTRLLTVVGRRSGLPRTTVVNLLEVDGVHYLVAPRGRTEWVRNLRADSRATLRLGRRQEHLVAHELDDADKLPILRAYLAKWKWEVGRFFEGLEHGAANDLALELASGLPVFRLSVPTTP